MYNMNFKNMFKDLKLKDFFIINSFIFCLFINTISNYRTYSFVLKGLSAILCLGIIYWDNKNYTFKILLKEKVLLLILLALIVLPSLSLLYSFNKTFGLYKIIQIIIGLIPVILLAYHLLLTLNAQRVKAALISIYFISLVLAVVILIFNPFIPYEVYRFTFNRWSHVLVGRFLLAFTLIIGFVLINSKPTKAIIINAALLIIFNYSIYLTTHRASILGIVFFYFFSILFLIVKRRISRLSSISFILSLIFSIIICIAFPPEIKQSENRIINLTKYDKNFGEDSPIFARIESFNITKDIFFKHPFLGVGFGGFKHVHNDRTLGLDLEYAHNIFFEVQTESGIFGTLIFLFLLYHYLTGIYKLRWEFLVFFVVMLWLACFSKDIPSQGMFWVGIVLLTKGYAVNSNRFLLS